MKRLNDDALAAAAKKLRKLRLEDVGGRKERPATTVALVMDRAFTGAGSQEGLEYILRHGVRYYLEALEYLSDCDSD